MRTVARHSMTPTFSGSTGTFSLGHPSQRARIVGRRCGNGVHSFHPNGAWTSERMCAYWSPNTLKTFDSAVFRNCDSVEVRSMHAHELTDLWRSMLFYLYVCFVHTCNKYTSFACTHGKIALTKVLTRGVPDSILQD